MPEKSSIDCVTLTFTWFQEVPQYGDKLLQRLNGFRQKNMFYDVTLKATDQDLAAHKVVLAACGGMFRLINKQSLHDKARLLDYELFRSHFIDRQTKKILSHVEEVTFDCPAAGLQCILKFAYSGVLEISEGNLLAAFQAAQATQMKEVEQICIDLAVSRLDWILKFDGSENTIPQLTSDGKLSKNEQDAHLLTVEDTFELLHKLIKLNASSFSQDNTSNCDVTNREEFPCLSEIEKRWPDLKSVYIAMIKCLQQIRKVKNPEARPSDDNDATQGSKPASGDSKQGKPDLTISAVEAAHSTEKKDNLPSRTADVPHVLLTKAKADDEKVLRTKSEPKHPDEVKPSTNTSNVENITKPKTKPRKLSASQHTRSLSGGAQNIPTISEDPKRKLNLSGSKPELSLSSDETSKATSSKTLPKSRKKHAAPKPPGPPPGASKPTPETRTVVASPSDTAKNPPPRPKPPSVKKSSESKADSPEPSCYDDSLNPFADEEEVSEPTNDYDDSLNPFG